MNYQKLVLLLYYFWVFPTLSSTEVVHNMQKRAFISKYRKHKYLKIKQKTTRESKKN